MKKKPQLRHTGARHLSKQKDSTKSARTGASASVSPSVSHGYFRSQDGTRLFYCVEGEGPPLVFCYGLVCSSLHWTYQIEHFRQNYQTIWMDYRGHHNSDLDNGVESLNLGTMSGDLVALLDELKISQAVFLGHSMAVNVLLELAHRAPNRVKALVLANGTAKRPFETMFGTNLMEKVFQLVGALQKLSPGLLKKLWKNQSNPISKVIVTLGGFNPHLTEQADVEVYLRELQNIDPAIFVKLVEEYAHYDATSWLHTLENPTLLITGEKDKITPPAQQRLMQQLIPNSKLAVIPKGSHCSQLDLPELVNEKIQEFLDTLDLSVKSREESREPKRRSKPEGKSASK